MTRNCEIGMRMPMLAREVAAALGDEWSSEAGDYEDRDAFLIGPEGARILKCLAPQRAGAHRPARHHTARTARARADTGSHHRDQRVADQEGDPDPQGWADSAGGSIRLDEFGE